LKCSSPVPPPPTRRLATYELQRYRPETRSVRARPSSTDTKPSPQDEENLGLSEALAHKSAQLDALKDCYSSLVKSFDDIAYSISQNKAAHELQEELGRVPLDDFDRVLDELSADNVPELAFLDDIVPANDEFKHDEADFGPEEGADKENARRSATLRPNSPAHSSSAGYDPHELLTSDELADQVRLKIAGSESKSSPLADSPSNVFGRKRKRLSQSTIPPYHPSSPSSSHPTRFIHKLADTTLDLGDEIQPGLPSCCNFNKLIQAARDRIQTRLELRNSRLNSSSSPSS
jgi:hypothetical protein